jgi:hypothetical protein
VLSPVRDKFIVVQSNVIKMYEIANKMMMFVYYGSENLNLCLFIVAVDEYVEIAAGLVKLCI